VNCVGESQTRIFEKEGLAEPIHKMGLPRLNAFGVQARNDKRVMSLPSS